MIAMQASKSTPASGKAHGVSHILFSHWFPTPTLLLPKAAGVDISDASIKWLVLERESDDMRVQAHGDEPLSEGIVVEGVVRDVPALAQALKELKTKWKGIECAHAALPEEAAYVFSMHVPLGTNREQALRMIEFELEGRVPIPPSAAVYDFNIIMEQDGEAGMEIGVTVFPRELSQSYAEAFAGSGINLLSLEVEASSIARSVSSDSPQEPITLLVDFGRKRTGFAVLKQGTPIFTSTVAVGGEAISRAIEDKLSLSPADAEVFKDEQGLLAEGGTKSPGLEVVAKSAEALADEVAKHYHYWDTRRNEQGNRMTPVGRVVLVGGSANLMGLDDYIAGRVQAEVIRGNIWRHVCEFSEYIPPIDRRTSFQYATALGLALRAL